MQYLGQTRYWFDFCKEINMVLEYREGLMFNRILRGIFSVCLYLCILSPSYAQSSSEEDCRPSNAEQINELFYAKVTPYVASVDRQGNPLLGPEEAYFEKAQHYYEAYKNFESVLIDFDAFEAITSANPNALENFESKLFVLGSNCEKISIYRGNLLGSYKAPFEEILRLMELGLNSNNQALIEFSSKKLSALPLDINEIIKILKNDFGFNSASLSQILPENFLRNYITSKEIPISLTSETALLTFLSLKGSVSGKESQLYFFVPSSFKGISKNRSAILLSSDGTIHSVPGVNVPMATEVLNRLGIPTEPILISEILTDSSGSCSLDEAGHWQQIIDGRKVRTCPFNSLVSIMLAEKNYINTIDYKPQLSQFVKVTKILDK